MRRNVFRAQGSVQEMCVTYMDSAQKESVTGHAYATQVSMGSTVVESVNVPLMVHVMMVLVEVAIALVTLDFLVHGVCQILMNASQTHV